MYLSTVPTLFSPYPSCTCQRKKEKGVYFRSKPLKFAAHFSITPPLKQKWIKSRFVFVFFSFA